MNKFIIINREVTPTHTNAPVKVNYETYNMVNTISGFSGLLCHNKIKYMDPVKLTCLELSTAAMHHRQLPCTQGIIAHIEKSATCLISYSVSVEGN